MPIDITPRPGKRPALAVLAPSSERGWFGGRALMLGGRVRCSASCDRATVDAELVRTFEGTREGATLALAPYEGPCRFVHFSRAVPLSNAQRDALGLGVLGPLIEEPAFDIDADGFRAAVRTAQDAIVRGDVYVVNLTARIEGRPRLTPFATFRALLARAAADMAAFVDGWDETAGPIASVSPERFVRIRRDGDGRAIEVWPIKGTRPRGPTPEEDERLRAALTDDAKERAEHVMVVDLERNDIGCIALPGSVVVASLMEVVATPYCHQMVSCVRGRLHDDTSVAEVLEALFPCGSVTGAPKRAAMRTIRELERSLRGAYCGALFVALPGEIDSSVLIRTLEWVGSDRVRWGAGCGITVESDPEAEWQELLLKSSPVLG